MLVSKIRVLSM